MHTGVVQYFIRLQGCQVGCYFCDTKYTWRPEKDYDKFVRMADIVKRAKKSKASWVCITGGEPFEQDLRPLIHKLRLEGLSIHIETSGQYIPNYLLKIGSKNSPDFIDWICLSPKDLFSVKKYKTHQLMLEMADEIKCVVTKKEDIDFYVQNFESFTNNGKPLILQPVDNDKKIATKILESIKGRENIRCMIQCHKVMDLR